MVATLKGPGHLRLGHDLQPLDKSWHGSSGIPRHRSTTTAWRWFPVHSGLDGALSQTGTWTKFFPAFLLLLSFQPGRCQSTKAHPSPSSPKWTTIFFLFTIAFMQTPFLWSCLLQMIGAIKAIITKVWMTYALATFKGCLFIQIPLRCLKMDSGGGSLWSGGPSGLLNYSRKLITPKLICQPHNCHPTPFISQFWL